MPKPQLAVQMYTVREYTKTPSDIAQTMKRIREIGYRAVQASALGPIDPKELRSIADGEGITICATHVAWERLRDEPDSVLEDHHVWDCDLTAIPSLPREYRNAAGYSKFAEEASEVGRYLAKNGLTLGYHNHSFEFERFGEQNGLEILFSQSDTQALVGELDTYWVQHGGGDVVHWINTLQGRLPFIHLKDMTIQNDQQIMAEVGEGNLYWPRIIEACRQAGVRWYIVEQDICQRDPFDSLKISLENLRAMGLET